MEIIFKPAVVFLNRLRYSQKFILIGLIFFLPFAILSYLAIFETKNDIKFAQKQRTGVEYIARLRPLLQHAQQNRGTTALYLRHEVPMETLAKVQVKMDNDFEELYKTDRKLGSRLETTEKLAALYRQWGEIKKNQQDADLDESFGANTRLITDTLFLVVSVGNVSNLVLDSKIDSFYLTDVFVNRIPQATEAMGQARGFGVRVVSKKIQSTEERLFLSGLYGMVQSRINFVNNALEIAFQKNPVIRANLGAGLQESNGATDSFLNALNSRLINAEKIEIPPVEYYSITTDAIDAVFGLHETIGPLLDNLFQTRIENLEQKNYTLEMLVAGIFVMVAYILAAFYVSVRRAISQLRESASRMTNEGVIQNILLETRDELGEAAGYFNALLNKLKEFSAGLEMKVQERTVELQKFKLAADNAADHIIITDPSGVILYANKAAEKITGYSRAEIVGQRPSLWGKQMEPKFYEKMWKTIKEEKSVFYGELNNRRKNGEQYVAAVNVAPILDEQGEVQFFVGIERNITKEKEIDRAKSEFVSLASHQLRTPPSAIKWFVEMLLGEKTGKITDERQKKYLQEIAYNNKRMIELVNQLLNVSRVELGTFSIEPRPTGISDVAEEALEELAPQIVKKELNVAKEYDKNMPLVNTDPALLRIIFQNLISNAAKYTPNKGMIRLTIKKEAGNFLIKVADDGCGIPIDQQSKIFTKLFRADNAREIDPDGTGLGLYIVQSIVKEMDGAIRFESEENKGSAFYVILPLKGLKKREGVKGLR